MARTLEGAVQAASGVELNGVQLAPVVEQCSGCDRIRAFSEQEFCSSYSNPARKWSGGRCNFATHLKTSGAGSARVNPLKASKRSAKGR